VQVEQLHFVHITQVPVCTEEGRQARNCSSPGEKWWV